MKLHLALSVLLITTSATTLKASDKTGEIVGAGLVPTRSVAKAGGQGQALPLQIFVTRQVLLDALAAQDTTTEALKEPPAQDSAPERAVEREEQPAPSKSLNILQPEEVSQARAKRSKIAGGELPFSFARQPFFVSPTPPSRKSLFLAAPRDGEVDDEDTAVSDDTDDDANGAREGFRWEPAVKQSLLFLSLQHGYAMTQPKTRDALHGPFFKDYARSVKSLHGWADGGRFFTNYVAHPLQGSMTGFIQIQNDPVGARQRFGASGAYWRSRLKAVAWTAAWSTQFEIGPVSQASIGNVGEHGKQTYVDLVMTPVGGLALLVIEDALDKYLVERIERRHNSYYLKITSRMLLNPTRSVANLLRFKKPWHRDAGLR